uniref:LysR family transcriptional regulator n=1 Tax=Klebsiella pneumoniae TaxID=573 RepID=UPI0036D31396
MNLRRLKYFVKIVDIGSLTQAAEVLHIAQPALSQQVATLEGEMDQQLLIRTKRGVTPTEAGKILYTHARTILGTVAKLAMRQPFVLFKGLTFQKLCLPGAFRPGDHHNK